MFKKKSFEFKVILPYYSGVEKHTVEKQIDKCLKNAFYFSAF